MPEIALTAQFLDRFAGRFGVRPAAWHSGVSGAQARAALRRRSPRARSRSWPAPARPCSCPSRGSGSSSSTRSTRPPTSRRTASVTTPATWRSCAGGSRARRSILASATPSIETPRQCRARPLRPRRPAASASAAAPLPQIRAVDLTREAIAAGPLALADRSPRPWPRPSAASEQALLFLNRRGYAPLTLCRACAHRYECPNCSAWLVEHRFRRALVCHHCGHVERRPAACTACGSLDSLVPCGPGVERIAEEVAELLPGQAHPRPVERLSRRHRAAAGGACGDRRGRVRHRHRHPARRQGAQFPAHDPRRRARCRYRPHLRRSAGGRAHLPAPAAGDGPGRPRRQARPGPGPDLAAGRIRSSPRSLSGDAERFYAEETRVRERPACRPSGASRRWSSRRRSGRRPRPMPAPWRSPPSPRRGSPSSARRRRRSPSSAAGYRFRLLVKTEREIDLQAYLGPGSPAARSRAAA